jgi:hypothetical protein
MGIFFRLEIGWSGIYSGMIAGLFFGFFMSVFVRHQENKAIASPPVLKDETMIREERASYQKGNRGVIGRLYLTDKRLLFEGLDGYDPFERTIPVSDLVGWEVLKYMGILPNRLRIQMSDGTEETFVTDNVRLWVKDIERLREAYLAGARPESARLFS